jgi:pantothenate kinase
VAERSARTGIGTSDGATTTRDGGVGRRPAPTLSIPDALARAQRLARSGRRVLLGIAGPPGGGKSTLAQMVVANLGERARLVGMDGFHLAQAELARLGRQDRKGAIDTFDVAGYVALLRRLRDPTEDVVYAPDFRREIEEPVASAVPVAGDVPLVVTEGNYLLAEQGDWVRVRDLLDDVWYVTTPEETRLRWLIERHVAYGKTRDAARAWALGSDQRNAELVEATKGRADAIVVVEDGWDGTYEAWPSYRARTGEGEEG